MMRDLDRGGALVQTSAIDDYRSDHLLAWRANVTRGAMVPTASELQAIGVIGLDIARSRRVTLTNQIVAALRQRRLARAGEALRRQRIRLGGSPDSPSRIRQSTSRTTCLAPGATSTST